MSQDILVVVDCKAKNAKMYAADANIAQGSSQGTDELYVKVPVGEQLRWYAVPLQFSEGIEGEGQWHVILTKVQLWGPHGTPGSPGYQGDAKLYLADWAVNNGGSDNPCYANQGPLTFQSSDGNQVSNETQIDVLGTNRPFVECTTQLTSRDEPQSPKLAYTFWCQIYENSSKVAEFSWDPFVTVCRP